LAEGRDIIFGDSINTDQLAEGQELNLDQGAGWGVMEALENGQGSNSDWDRTDTLNYIAENHRSLAIESVDSDGEPREGGFDLLIGGGGDDIIYGQEGNDTIHGGEGDDILSGGSGADTFVWEQGDAGTETSPAVDKVIDFNVEEGDVLNLSDLLQGEEQSVDALLNAYIGLSETADGNVELAISSQGDGRVDQKIVLENTSFNQLAGTSDASAADVLNTLLSNSQLVVDQS